MCKGRVVGRVCRRRGRRRLHCKLCWGRSGSRIHAMDVVPAMELMFFFSSRRRHTRFDCDWSSDVCSSDLQKNLGALVVDIGGGTTDYILYVDGAVKQSGALAIGGDHMTNDISMGLRIPMARAEKLKTEEGSCVLGNCLPGETILMKDDSGFAGKEIERETLNTIIHLRLRETFELLKRTVEEEPFINYVGAGIFITGGCSLVNGIDHLAGEIFEMPAHVTHAQTLSGLTSAVENPQFSTAIGLLRYAQAVQVDRPRRGITRIFGRFFSGMR